MRGQPDGEIDRDRVLDQLRYRPNVERATGQIVEVDGVWNGALLLASKAEIEREDDGSSPPPPPVTPPPVAPPGANRAPIANAGSSRTVAPGTNVTLDGRASRVGRCLLCRAAFCAKVVPVPIT